MPYKFLLLAILFMGSLSTGLKAQYKPVDKRITFAGNNVRLADFFNVVWDQTHMQAFYNDEQLSSDEKITVNFKREPLDNVLAFLLRKKKLTWYYREETFVILPKKPGEPDLGEMPDEATVNVPGRVTDKNGVPLQNASVIVKGSHKGAYTNEAGKFLIPGIRKKTALIISCIGYSPKTIQVFDDDTLKVQLDPAVTALDEVMVIAYGTSTRRNLTGAVNGITAKDIAQQPVTDPLLAMQGRVPGLNITQSSGLPGSYTKVELRGRNSIAAGNSPLYIVDGVPFPGSSLSIDNISEESFSISPLAGSNPLNMINVADIASIDVLKDADATAIYGSRGANGVILITTKSAKSQRMTMNANVYTGIGKMAHGIQYMNTQQYLQMRREAFKNDNAFPGVFDYDVTTWDTTRYTDWQKVLLGGTAHLKDAQLAFAGGDSIVQCRISAGYHRESTVYPSDFNYQKASGRVNLHMNTPGKRGEITLNTSYVADRNYLPSVDMTTYVITAPNTPEIYTPDGKLNWEGVTFLNPMANLLKVYKANTSNLLANVLLSYKILDGLQVKTSVGYNFMQMHEVQPKPIRSYNPAFNQVGNTNFGDGTSKSWIIEPQLTYDREIGQGRLEALVGATMQQETRNQEGLYAYGYTNDALLENRTSAPSFYSLGSSYFQYRYNALFGRIKYNWRGKYILNLTGRRDGSSRFGPGRQMANFGAVGAAWIFTNEPWVSNTLPFLSFGKLRASYGRTGNDQIADYGYYATYSTASPYQDLTGVRATRLYNANYGWELSNKTEIGLELGFKDDQLLLRTSYYNNRSSKQLVNAPISGLSGFNTIVDNYPALVENAGWEFEVNTQNIKSRHFTWNTAFNISIPHNRLLTFPGLENTPYQWFYSIGQPLNVYKGFHYTGLNENGIYSFKDVNDDQKIVSYSPDYAFTKLLGAFYYGGLQNSLSYRGIQLDVLFQFVKQNRFSYLYTGPVPGMNRNQPVAVLDNWQQKGDDKNVQKYTQALTDAYLAYTNMQQSDAAIEDASFVRLKNISLGYQLPDNWTRSIHLRSLRCYLQGQNLLTFTSYKGRDPEVAVDHDVYPPLRVWTLGIQLGL